eukprot:4977390-Pyramimonas_sp.AAC.1
MDILDESVRFRVPFRAISMRPFSAAAASYLATVFFPRPRVLAGGWRGGRWGGGRGEDEESRRRRRRRKGEEPRGGGGGGEGHQRGTHEEGEGGGLRRTAERGRRTL